MLLLLHTFSCVCVLTAGVSAVTTETVVGVAGRKVTLPCRLEAVGQKGVEVCWGRGEPSLFTCHNTVINTAGDQVLYRKSYRYSSSSSSSSLTIINSRPSDSGFYHCRVQLPGLFNDQTSTVHLIIINPRSVVSDSSDGGDTVTLNAPYTAGYDTRDVTEVTGSDVTGEDTTGPMVALVQKFGGLRPSGGRTNQRRSRKRREALCRDGQEAGPIRGGGGGQLCVL
ncbi:hepatitis A virus cellular receptor 2 homolog isoform X3 [Epinephelus lanceolatus]|uniref:hepatitis A virus cellular receptor 1 homolog isoform X3 n=1 Tax=Epinephelus lanceolatus TaxID=310571 RepID=UPI0014460176|nr:hepatitis A virus cellular receptor 1 homolog isoform X3 [Epinephelus lanceolatus]